jgi:hypothetical protein
MAAMRGPSITYVDLLNGHAAGSSNSCRSNALIDDGVVVAADDVVDDGRVVVDVTCLMMRNAIAIVAMAVEIVIGNKGEAIKRQAECEARAT